MAMLGSYGQLTWFTHRDLSPTVRSLSHPFDGSVERTSSSPLSLPPSSPSSSSSSSSSSPSSSSPSSCYGRKVQSISPGSSWEVVTRGVILLIIKSQFANIITHQSSSSLSLSPAATGVMMSNCSWCPFSENPNYSYNPSSVNLFEAGGAACWGS